MAIPALLRLSKVATEPDYAVPGRFDQSRGLRVYDTGTGVVPVVDARAPLDAITKTEQRRERDDDALALASITKTAVPRERDDVDIEPDETALAPEDPSVLLRLVTKTLHQRESDDE